MSLAAICNHKTFGVQITNFTEQINISPGRIHVQVLIYIVISKEEDRGGGGMLEK